jgi:hypothetical protein
MIAPNVQTLTPNKVQWKMLSGKDLYHFLLRKINQIGPIQKTVKEISVVLENRRMFATVLIRKRSIKLVFRADHIVNSPRILNMERVAEKNYDHTILIESKADVNGELLSWLADAYRTSS